MQTSFMLFLGDIGGSEVVLIMVAILVFFGADKIPELARGLGKGIREFKDASTEIRREFEQSGQPTPPNHAQQPDYGSPDPQHSSLSSAPAVEAASGFDPWATPAAPAAQQFEPAANESVPPVAHSLPPNPAPEGTQPRQPYFPPTPDA